MTPADAAPIVKVRGLHHQYRSGAGMITVLRKLDFDLYCGEFVAIMGTSGSGKSTFLHVLGCLQKPVAGSYRLNGEEITDLEERRLAEIRSQDIGQIFQMFHLLPEMDVVQNVSLPFLYNNVAPSKAYHRVHKALNLVGLHNRLSHKPTELSGGEMQRVAIARAIAQKPDLILADEPTGNLDEENSQEILKLFQQMNEDGHSLIMVTHDPGVACSAQKTYILENGDLRRA